MSRGPLYGRMRQTTDVLTKCQSCDDTFKSNRNRCPHCGAPR